MKVSYAGVGLNQGGRESPSGLRYRVRRIVDVRPRIRAVNVSLLPRDNKVWEISFTMAYDRGSLPAAEAFIKDFESALPSKGELKIIPRGGGTSGIDRWSGACLVDYDAVLSGQVAIITFQFLAETKAL